MVQTCGRGSVQVTGAFFSCAGGSEAGEEGSDATGACEQAASSISNIRFNRVFMIRSLVGIGHLPRPGLNHDHRPSRGRPSQITLARLPGVFAAVSLEPFPPCGAWSLM